MLLSTIFALSLLLSVESKHHHKKHEHKHVKKFHKKSEIPAHPRSLLFDLPIHKGNKETKSCIHKGVIRKHGEVWSPGACIPECHCVNAKVTCTKLECPDLNCKRSIKRKWKCCAECPPESQLGDSCGVSTMSGNANNTCCHFPYKYNDLMYYTCTYQDNHRPWCAVTANYDRDGVWGVCIDDGIKKKAYRVVNGKVEKFNSLKLDRRPTASRLLPKLKPSFSSSQHLKAPHKPSPSWTPNDFNPHQVLMDQKVNPTPVEVEKAQSIWRKLGFKPRQYEMLSKAQGQVVTVALPNGGILPSTVGVHAASVVPGIQPGEIFSGLDPNKPCAPGQLCNPKAVKVKNIPNLPQINQGNYPNRLAEVLNKSYRIKPAIPTTSSLVQSTIPGSSGHTIPTTKPPTVPAGGVQGGSNGNTTPTTSSGNTTPQSNTSQQTGNTTPTVAVTTPAQNGNGTISDVQQVTVGDQPINDQQTKINKQQTSHQQSTFTDVAKQDTSYIPPNVSLLDGVNKQEQAQGSQNLSTYTGNTQGTANSYSPEPQTLAVYNSYSTGQSQASQTQSQSQDQPTNTYGSQTSINYATGQSQASQASQAQSQSQDQPKNAYGLQTSNNYATGQSQTSQSQANSQSQPSNANYASGPSQTSQTASQSQESQSQSQEKSTNASYATGQSQTQSQSQDQPLSANYVTGQSQTSQIQANTQSQPSYANYAFGQGQTSQAQSQSQDQPTNNYGSPQTVNNYAQSQSQTQNQRQDQSSNFNGSPAVTSNYNGNFGNNHALGQNSQDQSQVQSPNQSTNAAYNNYSSGQSQSQNQPQSQTQTYDQPTNANGSPASSTTYSAGKSQTLTYHTQGSQAVNTNYQANPTQTQGPSSLQYQDSSKNGSLSPPQAPPPALNSLFSRQKTQVVSNNDNSSLPNNTPMSIGGVYAAVPNSVNPASGVPPANASEVPTPPSSVWPNMTQATTPRPTVWANMTGPPSTWNTTAAPSTSKPFQALIIIPGSLTNGQNSKVDYNSSIPVNNSGFASPPIKITPQQLAQGNFTPSAEQSKDANEVPSASNQGMPQPTSNPSGGESSQPFDNSSSVPAMNINVNQPFNNTQVQAATANAVGDSSNQTPSSSAQVIPSSAPTTNGDTSQSQQSATSSLASSSDLIKSATNAAQALPSTVPATAGDTNQSQQTSTANLAAANDDSSQAQVASTSSPASAGDSSESQPTPIPSTNGYSSQSQASEQPIADSSQTPSTTSNPATSSYSAGSAESSTSDQSRTASTSSSNTNDYYSQPASAPSYSSPYPSPEPSPSPSPDPQPYQSQGSGYNDDQSRQNGQSSSTSSTEQSDQSYQTISSQAGQNGERSSSEQSSQSNQTSSDSGQSYTDSTQTNTSSNALEDSQSKPQSDACTDETNKEGKDNCASQKTDEDPNGHLYEFMVAQPPNVHVPIDPYEAQREQALQVREMAEAYNNYLKGYYAKISKQQQG